MPGSRLPRHPLVGLAWRTLVMALALVAPAGRAAAQASATTVAPAGSARPAPAITARAGWAVDRWVAADDSIAVEMDREPGAAEGRVVVMVGSADLTTLFDRRGTQLVRRRGGMRLPAGASELTVYLATVEQWREIGRFPIRVLTATGFVRADVTPNVSLANQGQLAEGHDRGSPAPARHTFQDVQLAAGFGTVHDRGGWALETSASAVGVTDRRQALRFGQRGASAPRFDLAEYVVRLRGGPAALALGHVSLGANRHLVNGFSSRGVTLAVGTPALSLAVGTVGGSTMVGWDDPLGFEHPDHRVTQATVGVEALPGRPGALHMDATWVRGALRTNAGFDRGAVTDAERSSGSGVQLSASTPSQRVRIAGGVAESRFVHPRDPLLGPDTAIAPLAALRRMARYVETSVALVQGARPLGVATTSLTLGWRGERVDPLYRSVAAPTQSDLVTTAYDVAGTIGALTVQGTRSCGHDNLAAVASILTSHTCLTTAQSALPLGALAHRAGGTPWPTLGYTLSVGRQFGIVAPVNGGFAAGELPDQGSVAHGATVQWQLARWRVGYGFTHSLQDNRQPTRAHADVVAATHTLNAGLALGARLDLGADLSAERQRDVERATRATVDHLGLVGRWAPTARTGLAGNVAFSRSGDHPGARRASAAQGQLELRQTIGGDRRAPTSSGVQTFLRYARQSSTFVGLDGAAPLARTRREAWTLSSGVSLRVR